MLHHTISVPKQIVIKDGIPLCFRDAFNAMVEMIIIDEVFLVLKDKVIDKVEKYDAAKENDTSCRNQTEYKLGFFEFFQVKCHHTDDT